MVIVKIHTREVVIGDVLLEHVDDGMSVASGPFHPSSDYAKVRPEITAAAEARQHNRMLPSIELHAYTESGEPIETGFITIDDFSDVRVDPEATIQFKDGEQFRRLLGTAVWPAGESPRR
jgi:hypothetical protein